MAIKIIMKKILTILFLFVVCKMQATTYYVRTDGHNTASGLNNTNNATTGAWLTVAYATAHVSFGDNISIQGGTFNETAQIILPAGVSIAGIDSNTTIIKSTYNDTYKGIIEGVSTAGTNGSQSISNIKFDGQNLTNSNCIEIQGRSNVSIFNCSIRDFIHSGIILNGESYYSGVAPTIYATGNSIYNNTINNCAGFFGEGDGCIQIGGQDGFQCYGNNITNTTRTAGNNGWCYKFYNNGFCKNFRIHNNSFINAPKRSGDVWDFSVEIWNLSGLEFDHNIVQGSLDLNWNTKGVYPYSAYVHDNTFSQPSQSTEKIFGIYFEFETIDAIVENNTFSKIATPLFFVPRDYDTISNFVFRRNLCKDLGISGNPDVEFIRWGGNTTNVVNGYYIYNNTWVGLTGLDKPYSGLKFIENGSSDNIYIENNIVQNTLFGGIQFSGGSFNGKYVIRNNNTFGTSGISVTNTPSPYVSSGNITTDPLLTGTTDTLGVGSPAIDAGTYVGYPYNGSAPDMGYHENGAPDFVAPTIIGTIPTSGATGTSTVNPDTVIFSEIMLVDSINSRTFQLKQGSTIIPTTIQFIDSVQITMTPISQLSAFTTYTMSVTTDVKDAAGNNLASAFTSTFTTGALVNVPPVANAGADSTVRYPARSSVTLTGTATDSDGSIASTLWTLKYGANTPTITTASSLTTTVTGLIGGYYVFYLTATDNQGATGRDSVTVWVNDTTNVYATWNPSDNSSYLTLTNGNLTEADNSGGTQPSLVRGTIRLGGKKYWENTVYVGANGNFFLKVGVATSTATFAQPMNNDAGFWCSKPDGNISNNGNYSGYTGSYGTSAVVSCLFDSAAQTLEFAVNGVRRGIAFPASGYAALTGNIYPAAGFYNAGDSVRVNFGATMFAYPPPPGYTAVYSGGSPTPPPPTPSIYPTFFLGRIKIN